MDEDEDDSDESEYVPSSSCDEEEEEDDDDDDDDDDEDDDEEEDEEPSRKKQKSDNIRGESINIVLQIGPPNSKRNNKDEEEEYEEEEDDEEEYDEDDDEDEDEEEDEETNKKEEVTNNKKPSKEVDNLLKMLKTYENQKSSPVIKSCIQACEKEIKKTEKREEERMNKLKDKNAKEYKQLLVDTSSFNDLSSFRKMDTDEQSRIIGKIKDINTYTESGKSHLLTLLDSDIPISYKASAMKKFNCLKHMDPGNGEYYKIKNWVEAFMTIPFNKLATFPIQLEDGIDACHDFMLKAKETIDEAVYGLNDAKMQIMQMMGQLITNPTSVGTAIAIKGPMGTGKTTLVRDGISKILNRPFAFIALGGATDSSFLEGHSYTYEGSTWGKIVQILIESKCMNPVIYFDELDKISDTPKGEEIVGILTHLTDTTQNSQFHDKYFSDIDFDLSKCLFIFSYNDESKVNPILRDRMYRIETKGYDMKQKTIIAERHLIPTIRNLVKFKSEDIVVPKELIQHIIEHYVSNEDGVRNLKRALEIIFTKLNLFRLVRPNTQMFEGEISMDIQFPLTITKNIIEKLIKLNKEENTTYKSFYV